MTENSVASLGSPIIRQRELVMTSENVEMSFDGIVTDYMIERLKRDYFLGPYADSVLGDIPKSRPQALDREKSDPEEHLPELGTH